MNKSMRYLILLLLIIGAAYAVYALMNKKTETVTTVEKTETVAENVEGENSVDQTVTSDADVQQADQIDNEKKDEAVSEVKEEKVSEDAKVDELKKEEEVNKDSKPLKR